MKNDPSPLWGRDFGIIHLSICCSTQYLRGRQRTWQAPATSPRRSRLPALKRGAGCVGVGGGENWRETFRSTRFSTFEIALILIFYTRRKVFTMMLFHFLSYCTHLFVFTFSISDIGHKLSVDFLRTLQDSRDFDKRCCKDSAQAAGERHG